MKKANPFLIKTKSYTLDIIFCIEINFFDQDTKIDKN
jgi:hypothetical protein